MQVQLPTVKTLLLHLARFRISQWLIGWGFAHMSFALPVHRLRETSTLIAFHHPKPSYPIHILIVPKQALASFSDLKPGDTGFLADLVVTVQELVSELKLEQRGYRLIVNGGQYQDVALLHFHLISGSAHENSAPIESRPLTSR
jgi:histidine triad (HIT) family protein